MTNDNYILTEAPLMMNVPINAKPIGKTGNIRCEICLQTADDINRNRRRYSKQVITEGLNRIMDRINTRSFLGEMDHPVSDNPMRSLSVLYKECSHVITEVGWDGHKLIGVMETLSTTHGKDLKALIEDKIPVGMSLRGTGNISESRDTYGSVIYEVQGPLQIISYDSVSLPSHKDATLIRVTESVQHQILESININHIISETNNMICTEDENGKQVCYLPESFDYLVEKRKRMLLNKFRN